MRRLLTIVCVLFASVLAAQGADENNTNEQSEEPNNTVSPSPTKPITAEKPITADRSTSVNERTRNLTILAGLCIGLGVFYAIYLDYWSKWALWLRLAAVLGLMVLVESVILILFN